MANQCEVIEEQGFLTSTANPTIIGMMTEVGIVSNELTGTRSMVLFETIHGSDALSYIRSDVIREAGHFTGSFVLIGSPFELLVERGRLRDKLLATRSMTVTETGTLTDTPMFNRSAVIAEVGRLIDAMTPTRLFNVVINEQGKLADNLSYRRSMVIAEAGVLADQMSVSRSAVIAEVGTLVDLLVAAGLTYAFISETGVLADLVTQVLKAQMTVTEEGFVDGEAVLPGNGNGWTANTDTWGMSRYTGVDLNSMAVIDGDLYGAGAAGLYRIDADDDAGAPIAAGIVTGRDDMNNPAEKRLGYSYIGVQTNGDLLFDVRSSQAGHGIAYTYLFEPRVTGDEFGSTRAKPGRGQRSRYWSFGVRNKDGADFVIDDLLVLYDLTGRKV